MSACDPISLFDPQGNDLLLDYDRGSDELPHAPVIVPSSACYGQRGVIKVYQGQTVNLVLPVVDRAGTPIPLIGGSSLSGSQSTEGNLVSNLPSHPGDPVNPPVGYIWLDTVGDRIRTRLNDEIITILGAVQPAAAIDPNSSESSSSSSGVASFIVRFHAKANEKSRIMSINKACDSYDDEKGLVSCTLTQEDLPKPGLQPAQLVVYSPDGERLLQVTPYWLHVSPTLTHSTSGPLTIAEVRMVVADECPEANILLDALEFSDEQIAIFIRRCVDEFNEKYQPRTGFTCQNFPWRFHWSLGVAGHMLRSQSVRIRRNELHYQAGGVSIKDDEHAGDYFKIGTTFLDEWQKFVMSQKRTINYDQGWRQLLSGYSYRRNGY